MSIRATARLTDLAINVVVKLLCKAEDVLRNNRKTALKSPRFSIVSRREVLGNYRRQSQQSRLELGWVSAVDSEGRTIWIVDAWGYGKRFIVRTDES
jgi:hypothetical protein